MERSVLQSILNIILMDIQANSDARYILIFNTKNQETAKNREPIRGVYNFITFNYEIHKFRELQCSMDVIHFHYGVIFYTIAQNLQCPLFQNAISVKHKYF